MGTSVGRGGAVECGEYEEVLELGGGEAVAYVKERVASIIWCWNSVGVRDGAKLIISILIQSWDCLSIKAA